MKSFIICLWFFFMAIGIFAITITHPENNNE